MKYRNAIDNRSGQFLADIKSGNDLQTVLIQPGVLQ